MLWHLIRLLVWEADLRPPVFLVLTRGFEIFAQDTAAYLDLPAQADWPDQKTRTG